MQLRTLVEIDIDSATTLCYAQEDLEITEDSTGPVFYEGRIIDTGNLTKNFSNVFYGVRNVTFSTITLDNADGEFFDLRDSYEFRGKTLTLKWVDIDTSPDTVEETYTLRINSLHMTHTEARFSVSFEPPGALTKSLPYNRITTDDFPNAPGDSIGLPIPIFWGYQYQLPMILINDDTSADEYDYLICEGTISVDTGSEIVTRYIPGGDSSSDYFVNGAEYTLFDGSQSAPYPGYAICRFSARQEDASGALMPVYFTGYGLALHSDSYPFNPVDVLQEILTNSTWGLGQTVDSSSFATAAAIFDTSESTVDTTGYLYDPRSSDEVIESLLLISHLAQLSYGSSGYEITVPAYKATDDATFNQYNMSLIDDYNRDSDKVAHYINVKSQLYYPSPGKTPQGAAYLESTFGNTTLSFGITKDYNAPFGYGSTAGSHAMSLLTKRFFYQDRHIRFKTGSDAANLKLHDIIAITHPRLNLTASRFEVLEIIRKANEFELLVGEYSSDLFI